jgi:hypothetical protein
LGQGLERGQGLEVIYGYRFVNVVAAYEAAGLPLDIRSAASALGIPADLIFASGTTLNGAGQRRPCNRRRSPPFARQRGRTRTERVGAKNCGPSGYNSYPERLPRFGDCP